MKIFIPRGCRVSGGGKFQTLEKAATVGSSLWKLVLCAVMCAACARGQEAVSALELLRQSRGQVAVTNLDYALALAKAAVEVDPALPEAWKQQARVEMLRGKPAAAAALFDTVLLLKPDDADIPLWNLSVSLDMNYVRDAGTRMMQRDDAGLLKVGDALVARATGALLAQNFNGDAAGLAGRWAKIATNEDSRAAAAALELLARGDNAGALAALEKIKKGSPPAKELLANAWLRIGRLCARREDTEAARAAFARALEIWPGWSSAVKELAGPGKPPAP